MISDGEFTFPRQFNILITDDCESARHLVQIALEHPQLTLHCCTDGLEAIEYCKSILPDLLVCDVQMPGATGIEVCQWLKANSGSTFVPIILLTSQGELDDKVNGLNCGADDYVTKPFQLPELSARVRAMLRIKDLADRLKATKELLHEKEKLLVAMQVGGAAAHELGQPLTALLLNCQLLAKLAADLPEGRQAITSIQQQCDVMRKILAKLNSLTDFKVTEYVEDMQILDLGTS